MKSFARIDRTLSPDWTLSQFEPPRATLTDLYEGENDDRFNWNRVDDLIIRLYGQVLAAQ